MNTKTTDLKSIIAGLFFTCILSTLSYAQNVGINGTGNAPDASAMLDVDATNKGVLLPRVALTGTTDATTITTPATSLLVYNTASNGGVIPGYYYNSGTPASPVWTSFSSPSKFTINFEQAGAGGIDATPSPIGGLSGGQNTDYGDPAISAPNNFLWLRDAIFTVKSNCTFNGLNGWMAQPFGSSGTVTLTLYRFRPISNTPSPIGTLVASTTLTCANASNMYYYTIAAPAIPFTAQAGDIFVLFASSPSSGNCYGQGSIEFINN